MVWLKRNLIFVVGGVIALVLLGAAGFFLWSSYGKNAVVSEDLSRAAGEYTRLSTRSPSAVEENVDAAQTEQKRLEAFIKENQAFFAPFGTRTNIDSAEFKSLLETTIADLEEMADSSQVVRPKNFGYTFEPHRESVVFLPADLLPWTYQVLEIRELCEIVYSARVHSLLAIRRSTSSTNDVGANILRDVTPSTNQVAHAVVTPYEIVFQGFTSELSAVLQGLV